MIILDCLIIQEGNAALIDTSVMLVGLSSQQGCQPKAGILLTVLKVFTDKFFLLTYVLRSVNVILLPGPGQGLGSNFRV